MRDNNIVNIFLIFLTFRSNFWSLNNFMLMIENCFRNVRKIREYVHYIIISPIYHTIKAEKQLQCILYKFQPHTCRSSSQDSIQTGKTTASCQRAWRLSASWASNWGPHWSPWDHHSTIVVRGFRGALNWSPLHPESIIIEVSPLCKQTTKLSHCYICFISFTQPPLPPPLLSFVFTSTKKIVPKHRLSD